MEFRFIIKHLSLYVHLLLLEMPYIHPLAAQVALDAQVGLLDVASSSSYRPWGDSSFLT